MRPPDRRRPRLATGAEDEAAREGTPIRRADPTTRRHFQLMIVPIEDVSAIRAYVTHREMQRKREAMRADERRRYYTRLDAAITAEARP